MKRSLVGCDQLCLRLNQDTRHFLCVVMCAKPFLKSRSFPVCFVTACCYILLLLPAYHVLAFNILYVVSARCFLILSCLRWLIMLFSADGLYYCIVWEERERMEEKRQREDNQGAFITRVYLFTNIANAFIRKTLKLQTVPRLLSQLRFC